MRKQVLRVMLGSTGLVAGVLVGFPGVAHADTVTIDCPSHVGDVAGLQDAIDTASGARTIVIPSNCVFTVDAPYELPGPIATDNAMPVVTEDITITSRYSTITRSSEDLFRIFEIDSGGSLTMQGITVSDGSIDGNGGCYFVAGGGSLTLTRSPVRDCTATGDGGGIFVQRAETAPTRPSSAHLDAVGAVRLATGRAARRADGVVYDVVLNRSDLVGNDADSGGGMAADSGNVQLVHVYVGSNTASDEGGGLYSGGALFDVNSSTLTLNSALTGGGFDNEDGTMNFYGSYVLTNEADNGGGIETDSTTMLRNTVVTNNTATSETNSGGGINWHYGPMPLLYNSPVTANIPNNCVPLGTVTNCFG